MSDFGRGAAGLFEGFSDVMSQHLTKQMADKQAEGKKRRNVQELTQIYMGMYGADEEKAGLAARAAMMGVGMPASALTPKKEKADLSGMFKQFNSPDWLQTLYESGHINEETAFTMTLKEAGATVEDASDAELERIHGSGLIDPKYSLDDLKAMRDMKKYYGQKTMDMMMAQPEAGAEAWNAVVWKAGNGYTLDELSAPEKIALTDRYPDEKDREYIFGQGEDAGKYFTLGQKSIIAQAGAIGGGIMGFGWNLSAWQAGTLNADRDKAMIAFFDKNYNKATGEMKPEVIMAEGKRVYESVAKMGATMNLNKSEQDALRQLITHLQSGDIDWTAIQRDMGVDSGNKVRRAYMKLKNQGGM